jgi:hypothetical protein
MSTIFGNVLALIVIGVSVLVGINSLETSAITFLSIVYAVWVISLVGNWITNPSKKTPFCKTLSLPEIEIYQRYHLNFIAPGTAEMLSCWLNSLRLAGFVWGGLCLWNGLYWLGGLSIAYFFVTGFLILKLHPWLYLGAGTQKGNPVAIKHIPLMEKVNAKRETYFRVSIGDEDNAD